MNPRRPPGLWDIRLTSGILVLAGVINLFAIGNPSPLLNPTVDRESAIKEWSAGVWADRWWLGGFPISCGVGMLIFGLWLRRRRLN